MLPKTSSTKMDVAKRAREAPWRGGKGCSLKLEDLAASDGIHIF